MRKKKQEQGSWKKQKMKEIFKWFFNKSTYLKHTSFCIQYISRLAVKRKESLLSTSFGHIAIAEMSLGKTYKGKYDPNYLSRIRKTLYSHSVQTTNISIKLSFYGQHVNYWDEWALYPSNVVAMTKSLGFLHYCASFPQDFREI